MVCDEVKRVDRVARHQSWAYVLTKDRVVLEPTSGNTGISLAMICRIKSYRLKVLIPESVSAEHTELLTAFGAEIVYSDALRGTNGSIEVADQIAAEDPTYFTPYQYGNEMNPHAHYETTGPEILRDLPEIDVFVAGMGTGGTLTGTGRYLKEKKPGVKIVAAVPHPGDLVQGLRSQEEGFIPPVLDESILDGKIVVDSHTSFASSKELTQKEGIFADGGWKYLSTQLWTTDYKDLPSDIEDKICW